MLKSENVYKGLAEGIAEDKASHAAVLYLELINETFIPLCVKSGIAPTTDFFRKTMCDNQLKATELIVWDTLTVPLIGGPCLSDVAVYKIRIEFFNTLIRFSNTIEKLRVFAKGMNEQSFRFGGYDIIPSVENIYIKSGKAILKISTQRDIKSLHSACPNYAHVTSSPF